MDRVAIIQPNYLPWKGYFDILRRVDALVVYDDVQYTKRDWRNRNRIKLPNGELKWLSVPVIADRHDLIRDVVIDRNQNWVESHCGLIRHAYARAPHFDRYFPELEAILNGGHERLLDLDLELTRRICAWLGISTPFISAAELNAQGTKDDRLLDILTALDARAYVSGPSARDYIKPQKFEKAGIELVFYDYPNYPVYPQLGESFIHEVSVIDLLFCVGPAAPKYIWG